MPAKIVTFFNQKGGVGKTNACMSFAGIAVRRGYRVLVVDGDKQATASQWSAAASDERPFGATVISLATAGRTLPREIRGLVDDFDLVAIDCPPAIDSDLPSAALTVSDLGIIVVVPRHADLWAMQAAKLLGSRAQAINPGLQLRVLANMVSRSGLSVAGVALLGEDAEVPLLSTCVHNRTAYAEAPGYGAIVHDVPGARQAREEMDRVTDEMLDLLNLRQIRRKSGRRPS